MLAEMIDSGVFELGSHTLNHLWLSQVGPGEARREIFESKKVLSDIFNYPVKHFAYPGGFEAPWVVDLVKEAGYETAMSTKAGVNQTPDKILTLKRVRVGNLNEAEFATLLRGERFKE
jgi:peptidoglycan/xylan/chitin deacetylase (PgdA/CDA1 family)